MDYSIFKSYDIRGIYPNQINEETAYKLGRAYATWIKSKKEGAELKVAVGSDMRVSSPALKAQIIAGLSDSGIAVDDIGLVSTPTFYFAAAYYGYDGGLQVSASHNPKEYNGLKIVGKNGTPVSADTGLLDLKKIIEDGSYIPLAETHGALTLKENIVEEEAVQQLEGFDTGKIKPFKIVIDASNGMGSVDMDALFKRIPGEVIRVNFELDGTFPAHGADPMKPENIAELQKRVLEERADLGIAPDGDGDRVFFVDEKGDVLPQPILRGIMAQIELRETPGALVAYDIRPGKITADMIAELGGKAIVTPVGHSLIKEEMIQTGAIFGGESSGHYYYKLPYGTFEAPMLMVAKFLRFLSEEGKTLSEVVAPLKKYYSSGEINIPITSREAGLEKIDQLKLRYADSPQNLIDGLSVDNPEYWFNVRLSNTEPLARVTVEGITEQTVQAKAKELKNFFQGK